jgi:hypothetical protein
MAAMDGHHLGRGQTQSESDGNCDARGQESFYVASTSGLTLLWTDASSGPHIGEIDGVEEEKFPLEEAKSASRNRFSYA